MQKNWLHMETVMVGETRQRWSSRSPERKKRSSTLLSFSPHLLYLVSLVGRQHLDVQIYLCVLSRLGNIFLPESSKILHNSVVDSLLILYWCSGLRNHCLVRYISI